MARTRGPFGIPLWAACPFPSGPAPQIRTGRRMSLVPAASGRRHTVRPRVRPQTPAPAFVNDEARRLRRHVSRDVSGARFARLLTLAACDRRTDCVGRAAGAGSEYRPAPSRARGRAASRPSQTARRTPPNTPAAIRCGRNTCRPRSPHLPQAYSFFRANPRHP